MKDIYELLNDMDMDVSKYENMDVNMPETTKKRLGKKLCKEVKELKEIVESKEFKSNKKNPKSKKYLKNTGKGIVAAVALFTVIGVANPTFAKGLPGIGELLNFIEKNSSFANSNYAQYKENLDLQVSDKGINLNLNSVAYDGSSLYLTCGLDTEEKIDYTVSIIDEAELTINGKNIKGKSKLLEEFAIDNEYNVFETESREVNINYTDNVDKKKKKEYVMLTRWDLGKYNLDKNIEIQWDINKISGIEGKWSFKFKGSKEALMEKTKRFENVGQYKVTDEFKFNLDSIIFNPFGTTIENTVAIDDNKWGKTEADNYGKTINNRGTDLLNGYILVTDKGEELFHLMERVISEKNKDNKEVAKRYNDFTSLKEIPKNITIIPVIRKVEDSNFREQINNYEQVKIGDIKEGTEITQGTDKTVVVNSIKKENSKVTFNISFKGLGKENRFNIFAVTDKDKYVQCQKEHLQDPNNKKKEMNAYNLTETDRNQSGDWYYEKTYALNGSIDYTFENINDDSYLFIQKFDELFEIDMSGAQTIDLTKSPEKK